MERAQMEHVWENMTHHSFPDRLPAGKAWQMKKMGICGMRCAADKPRTWYLPNYIPFRPPPNEEYPHGVLVHYTPDQDEEYRSELTNPSTSYQRRLQLLSVGSVKTSEMRVRSLEMWNCLVEIYAPDQTTYDFISVPEEAAVTFVVEVHLRLLQEDSHFKCHRYNVKHGIEKRVVHIRCKGWKKEIRKVV